MGAALAVAKRILQHHRYIFESAHGPWRRHLRSPYMDRGELALPPLLNLWGALNEALPPEGGEIARLSDKYQRGLENLVGGRALSVLLKSSVRDEVKLTPADKECLVFGVIDPANQERVSREDSEADPLRGIAAELEQIRRRLVEADREEEQPRCPDEPAGVEPSGGGAVQLGKIGEPVWVNGKEKNVTVPQYSVLKALLDAGERGLSLGELGSKSGYSDPRGILRTLRKDSAWEGVIKMAGRPYRRYRLE